MSISGSMLNHLMGNSINPSPHVGMAATMLHYSDRTPCTIVEVKGNGKVVTVQEDRAVRIDKNSQSESQQYEYSRNVYGAKETFSLRKGGTWVALGQDARRGGDRLLIGHREKYYDYSF